MTKPEAQPPCCGIDVRADYERIDEETLRCPRCGKYWTRAETWRIAQAQPQGVELLHWRFRAGVEETMCGLSVHSGVGAALLPEGATCPLCQAAFIGYKFGRADLARATAAEQDVWDRLNKRRHELIDLKRRQGFLEERDEADFNALQCVAGLVRELVADQPFQVNNNPTITTPRATGEIEAALAELREIYPKRWINVICATHSAQQLTKQTWTVSIDQLVDDFEGLTLADCMAQVRAAARTEGGGKK